MKKRKLLLSLTLILLLMGTFWYGGNAPNTRGFFFHEAVGEKANIEELKGTSEPENQKGSGEEEEIQKEVLGENSLEEDMPPEIIELLEIDTIKESVPEAVGEGAPNAIESENSPIGNEELTCTISISCETILDNMDYCNPEKIEIVPEDGWILKPVEVVFYEGESIFNVLQRTTKQNKIHMEYVTTPMYDSSYIEGIHNLYEFDVGELSGWVYKVNEWFPNYGCSLYELKDGDIISFLYTCDYGVDVGDLSRE